MVIGWVATRTNGLFLIPMTALNLVSLIVLLRVMFKAKRGSDQFDPLQPNSLLSASSDVEKGLLKWEDKVKYHREVRAFHR